VPAPRKYDAETMARAVRMYQDRLIVRGESKLTARRAVGALLGINPATLRNWVEREEIDTGARPGTTTDDAAELARLRRENAELRRANEILKTASAFFAQAELDRRLR
jgi:transposase